VSRKNSLSTLYAKKLERVEFRIGGQDEKNIYDDYARYLRGSRLKALMLHSFHKESEPKETCDFSRYPQTLKTLELDKVEFLSSLPKLKNLENLTLTLNEVPMSLISPDLMSWLLDLKCIKLKISFFSKNAEVLLDNLSKGKNVKSLYFENIREKTDFITSFQFFNNFANLESLSLHFSSDFCLRTDITYFQLLPPEICKLAKLRFLKLYLNNKNKSLLLSFIDCIQKLTLLEELRLISDYKIIDHDVIFEVIPVCRQISSLKKLVLNFRWFELQEQVYHELGKMIQSLKSLQVLKLGGLIISSFRVLKTIIEIFGGLGVLEQLEILEIDESIENEDLIESFIKLLSLKGLKELRICDPRGQELFKDPDGREKINKAQLQIERVNPGMHFDKAYYHLAFKMAELTIIRWTQLFIDCSS